MWKTDLGLSHVFQEFLVARVPSQSRVYHLQLVPFDGVWWQRHCRHGCAQCHWNENRTACQDTDAQSLLERCELSLRLITARAVQCEVWRLPQILRPRFSDGPAELGMYAPYLVHVNVLNCLLWHTVTVKPKGKSKWWELGNVAPLLFSH